MSLPFLALTVRSLREDARGARTHVMRAVLVALILGTLMTTHASSFVLGASGLAFFSSVTSINLFLVTFLGGSLFAAAITEEKEAGSLGLLKLTGLSPLSILLGKSAGLYVTIAVLLALQLPFALLAITFGGITARHVLSVFALLAVHALFVGSLGLLCSVVCERTRAASWLTFGTLFLLWLGPSLVRLWAFGMGPQPGPEESGLAAALEWFESASAFAGVGQALSLGFTGGAVAYPVLVNTLGAAALVLLAWAVFERSTRNEKPEAPERSPLIGRSSRRRRHAGRAWDDALAWKDFRFLGGGWYGLLAMFLLYAGVIAAICAWIVFASFGPAYYRDLAWVVLMTPLIALPLHAGSLAARFLSEEVKWKTLSNLAMLPTTLGAAAYRKALGAAMQLLPGIAWLVIGFMLCAYYRGEDLAEGIVELIDEPGAWYAVGSVLFGVHLTAWLSLYIRRGALALAIAILYFGNSMLMGLALLIAGPGAINALLTALAAGAVVGSVLLHPWIGKRLDRLAAE